MFDPMLFFREFDEKQEFSRRYKTVSMAKYDLTCNMSQYFDPHMVIPLFEFLSEREIYDEKHILTAKLELLRNTNMVDFSIETFEQLHGESVAVPQELKDRRNVVIEKLKSMHAQTEVIVNILEDKEVNDLIKKKDRDGRQLLDHLTQKFDFHPDMLDMMYKAAKFQFECGNYSATAEYLYFYRLLVVSPQQNEHYLNALWGKLASEILVQNWDDARDDLNRLKGYIDTNTFESELELLHQRAWWIHWSLFVFFNHPKGRDEIIEQLLMNNNYLNTIQILCPHVLRYLTAAVVVNKKRRQVLKELVSIVQLESYHYKDPITEFVECLYVKYDFDMAQQKLRESEQVLVNDFFLTSLLEDFMESARLLVFEMYCRIHQCISIE
uniref:Eukaryotic translation initiation factor 3 subunit E n=2 Tax=Romanomermis culicivorax TaxID=13658 RepID=A0A915JDE8_ROMCU